jgi:hypothetical protein
MLDHFTVSNLCKISPELSNSGYLYQVNVIETNDDQTVKNNTYRIKSTEEISIKLDELKTLLLNYTPVVLDTLSAAKSKKLGQINNQWLTLEQTGWDSGQGYHLGITPSDVALIVGVYSLAREASAMGMPLPKLISMENNSIEFETIQDMTVLLMYYGKDRSDMAKSFAQKRKAIEAATTIEEVNAIS